MAGRSDLRVMYNHLAPFSDVMLKVLCAWQLLSVLHGAGRAGDWPPWGVTCFLPHSWEMQIIKALTGKPVCSLHSNLYQQMCRRVPVKASVKTFCNLKPMESKLGIKNQMQLRRKNITHSGSTHSLKTAAVHML